MEGPDEDSKTDVCVFEVLMVAVVAVVVSGVEE